MIRQLFSYRIRLCPAAALLAAALLLAGCMGKASLPSGPRPASARPSLEDKARFCTFNHGRTTACSRNIDLRSQGLHSWMELDEALRHSLAYVRGKPQGGTAMERHGVSVTWGQLRQSIEEMLHVLPLLDRRPELLAQYFEWFSLSPPPLMTGYYTPEIEASLTPRPGYTAPIYGVPPDLRKRNKGQAGVPSVYRVEKGRVLPYHTRADVELGKVLAGRGLEIAWAKDPVDVFYLQVEGQGRLRLPDGTVRYVVYGERNGHPFTPLGNILHSRGYLPKERRGQKFVRQFFERHRRRWINSWPRTKAMCFSVFPISPPWGPWGAP